ncbi:trans-aconitate 2-methyltransferase [Pontibacter sp. SGAir0037]|uniref:class I SAM-dependent methyltransferase n=1 Tax=Pontibacter sp. SGAir0037 TaxID=2571030 RepID=UPI0010CD3E8A|nr:class I SAM-dependent methyltransferase [Pontibacter sp. SGAir0037]QCR23244.1 class I SAM-dependent methyltransferase [Pontibacter sp. SGAir0037]
MSSLPESGFDRTAFFYDRLAKLVFGSAQENAQLALLPFIPAGARVLIIGGGSGWLLEQVLNCCSATNILYIDASPAMLTLARKRYNRLATTTTGRAAVEFRTGTEVAVKPEEQFEAIITPFLLDLFPPQRLSGLMKRLQAALAPQGYWLFADFWPVQQPTPRWQRLLLWSMYAFFGVLSGVKAKRLPDYQQHFQQLRLHETFSKSFYQQMIQAKVFQQP